MSATDRPTNEQVLLDLLDRIENSGDWDQVNDMILSADLTDEQDTLIHGVRAVIADNEALRRQILALKDTMAKVSPVIQALWDAAVMQILPVFRALEPYLSDDAPMGAEWDAQRTERESRDAGCNIEEPEPENGDMAICSACSGAVRWIDSPYGGWWSHEEHPADHHDAVVGDATTPQYETDAEPQPKHGDHGTCAACGQEIEYRVEPIRNGLDTDVQNARWIHTVVPVNGHIAVLGGPA